MITAEELYLQQVREAACIAADYGDAKSKQSMVIVQGKTFDDAMVKVASATHLMGTQARIVIVDANGNFQELSIEDIDFKPIPEPVMLIRSIEMPIILRDPHPSRAKKKRPSKRWEHSGKDWE